MRTTRALAVSPLVLAIMVAAAAGCAVGPSENGSFDRTFSVTTPIRLELANASGDVSITGSADSKVHVHAEVRSYGMGFGSPKERLDEIVSHPPVEQRGDTIRVGKDLMRVRNIAITYTIEVPHDTEVESAVASGTQTIHNVRGPVKAEAASGSIHADRIERLTQLHTVSGSIDARDIGDDIHASSTSGSVTVSNIKGDVRISALSGSTQVTKPGGRVDANTGSGTVEVQGATRDVKAHAGSGRVDVQGDPGASSYWDLKTVSGMVQLGVPASANFHLSAEAVSGQIKADVPIVIEEQGKHSLRARVGNGGGRVEVHTVSGEIRVRGT